MENEEPLSKEAIERLDDAVADTAGRVKAQQLAIALLIRTHPDRATLRAEWHQALPQWLDLQAKKAMHQHPRAREAFHSELAMVSKLLDSE